jgi:S-adenosylmethionine-diacylgycerolhomoserine-N-methlytransferase
MLATAEQKLARAGVSERIVLRTALAERLDYARTFGLSRGFDAIFYSYSLSMIPPWRSALAAGWENLRPGGRLLALDFWDAAGLPRWCGRLLHQWLACFHTRPQPDILTFVENLPGAEAIRVEAIGPRYAFLISCRKG